MTSEQSHAPSSTSQYYAVFIALLVLLAITVAAAEVDLGSLNFPLAALIASAKAALIMLFFMHVWHSRPLIWLVAGAGIFWLGVLLMLTMSDYFTRGE
jgi:cytochrome c oxidase subunit 4